ncbi:MAG TPA: class IV adenylate cyclase [Chitinophagaceae bacterium]|nr:class IV adenylate cyclase [Chitinophagaceae bacterium]
MAFINVEIKARTEKAAAIREYLIAKGAEFKGTDQQTDTYFNTRQGRLKLREGNIENNLIYYERNNQAGPKQSHFSLLPVTDAAGLKAMLAASMGIKVVVEKKREIYFIGNVKFHLDTVQPLGHFVEIEASNKYADLSPEALDEQCRFYLQQFGIQDKDLVEVSYSDMLLALPAIVAGENVS